MTKFGKLVILTGVNGAGKGTIGPLLEEFYSQLGEKWVYIYGPKANAYTTSLRELVLDPDPAKRPSDPLADAFLWFSQHAESAKVIAERRAEGENIILDRGPETAYVYNVLTPGLEISYPWLGWLYQALIKRFNPDLVIVMNVTAQESIKRSSKQLETDHYQLQQLENHEKRRQLFERLGLESSWVVIDAMPPIKEVLDSVVQEINKIPNLIEK